MQWHFWYGNHNDFTYVWQKKIEINAKSDKNKFFMSVNSNGNILFSSFNRGFKLDFHKQILNILNKTNIFEEQTYLGPYQTWMLPRSWDNAVKYTFFKNIKSICKTISVYEQVLIPNAKKDCTILQLLFTKAIFWKKFAWVKKESYKVFCFWC